MDWGQILFSFTGRINRAKYWLAALFYFVALLVLVAVAFAAGISAGIGTMMVILVLIYIPFLISSLAVAVKRLHDRNKSGWWLLLFYLVPAILDGLGKQIDAPAATILLSLASLAIAVWAFVELGCLRGTAGPNQYGPDPLGFT